MLEAILLIVSIIAGILGSLLGLGGGFIIVPALSFMNIGASEIASTSLFAVFATSFSSTIAYAKQGRINYELGIKLTIFAIPGSILGAYLSSFISLQSFMLYFAIILIATSLYMLKKDIINIKGYTLIIVYIASFFAGFISSMFGIGGGIIYLPLMIGLLAIPSKISTATSQFILLISSVIGLTTHTYLAHPNYTLAIILIIGTFAGAQIGARISLLTKEQILRKFIAIALIAIAIRMLIESLF